MTENWEQCGRRMAFDVMTGELEALIRRAQDSPLRIIVGTDSQVPVYELVTAI